MNDFVRDKLTFDGRISLGSEIIAGGCAGASQVNLRIIIFHLNPIISGCVHQSIRDSEDPTPNSRWNNQRAESQCLFGAEGAWLQRSLQGRPSLFLAGHTLLRHLFFHLCPYEVEDCRWSGNCYFKITFRRLMTNSIQGLQSTLVSFCVGVYRRSSGCRIGHSWLDGVPFIYFLMTIFSRCNQNSSPSCCPNRTNHIQRCFRLLPKSIKFLIFLVTKIFRLCVRRVHQHFGKAQQVSPLHIHYSLINNEIFYTVEYSRSINY